MTEELSENPLLGDALAGHNPARWLADAVELIRECRLADAHALRTGDEGRWDRAFHDLCRFEQQAKPILAARAHPASEPLPEVVERVARAIYRARPFAMASTTSTFWAQVAQTFDWDGAPAFYQADMLELAKAALAAMPASGEVGQIVAWLTDTVFGDDLLDEASVKLAELIEQRFAPTPSDHGWRDIASAPRDGSRVLLGAPQWTASACGIFNGVAWTVGYDLPPFLHQPTHWQPLPAAPDREGGR